MVPRPGITCWRYPIWPQSRRLGHRLCLCWVSQRRSPMAWQIRCGPIVLDPSQLRRSDPKTHADFQKQRVFLRLEHPWSGHHRAHRKEIAQRFGRCRWRGLYEGTLWASVCQYWFCCWLFIDFPLLQKCLDKDPAKRYSCEQLLSHAFFKNFTFKFPESELEDFERLRRVIHYYTPGWVCKNALRLFFQLFRTSATTDPCCPIYREARSKAVLTCVWQPLTSA